MPKPTDATINGPASTTTTATILFDLGDNAVHAAPTINGHLSGWLWSGTETLSPSQISDLESGKWYANILSTSFPGGELRGQILPVPEPSSFALLALGTALFIVPALSSIQARKIRRSK